MAQLIIQYIKKSACLPFGILIVLILSGCNSEQFKEGRVYEIDLSSPLKGKEIFLSDIASRVHYVQLETSSDALVGDGIVRPAGENYLIYQDEKPLLLFNSEGKLVSQIGNIGNGPGEYRNAYFSGVYDPDSTIYVLDMPKDKIHKFKYNGSFVNSISLSVPGVSFEVIGKDLFLLYTPRVGNTEEDKFGIYLQSGDSIIRWFDPAPDILDKQALRYTFPVFHLVNENLIIANDRDYRTLKAFTPEGESFIISTVNAGKWQIPLKDYSTNQSYHSVKDRFIHNLYQFVTPENIIIQYKFENELVRAIYSRNKSSLFRISNWDEYWDGIINDIDNGPAIGNIPTIHNGFGYRIIHAIDLLENIKEGLSVPSGKLSRIVENLQEDSNPIIMVVDFK